MRKLVKAFSGTLLAITLGFAVVACTQVSDETKAAAGIYQLQSIAMNGTEVSGDNIAAVAERAGVSVLLSLELFDTGRYKLVSMDEPYEGNFKIEGNQITFTDGQDLTGSYENNTVTIDIQGIHAVFTK